MSELNPKSDAEPQLPEALRRVLQDLHTPTSKIPANIDHAILGLARSEFRGRRRMWVGTRWAAIALTAAAMVVIAVRMLGPVVEGNKPQLARVGDVNHDNQ